MSLYYDVYGGHGAKCPINIPIIIGSINMLDEMKSHLMHMNIKGFLVLFLKRLPPEGKSCCSFSTGSGKKSLHSKTLLSSLPKEIKKDQL